MQPGCSGTFWLLATIISANAHEIAFNRRALYVVWALFLLFSTIFAIAALLRANLLIVLTTWAVAVLIWNGLFPHAWLNSPIKIATAVVAEFAIVGALFFILSRLPLVAVTSAGAIFTVMTVAASAPQHYKLLTTLPGKHEQAASAHRKDLPPLGSEMANIEGNVYHIVMDAFSAPYITHWLSREEKTSLEGFTFYPSAIANYGWTNLSMRTVFSGKLHAEPNSAWGVRFPMDSVLACGRPAFRCNIFHTIASIAIQRHQFVGRPRIFTNSTERISV